MMTRVQIDGDGEEIEDESREHREQEITMIKKSKVKEKDENLR